MRLGVPRRALALACALVAGAAAAQSFPSRPIRILVPFTPGGTNDILARTLGPRLGDALGQPVLVENRPGGNTVIASQALLASEKDGHTLLLPGNSHVVVPHLTKSPLPFHSVDDFAPVATLARTGLFLVVHPALPAHGLREFIALAKAKPGAMNSAAPGGSINQLATEMFNTVAGVKLVHVPYKGASESMAATLGGQVDLTFFAFSTALKNAQAGKLRPIAIGGAKRNPQLPNVPAIAEAVPGYVATSWTALVAPPATPAAIQQKLAQAMAEIVRAPDVQTRLVEAGDEPVEGTPAQMAAFLREEAQRWAGVIKSAGITTQ